MAIPTSWKRTNRPPVMIDNFEWLSYRTGINRFALHCHQIEATVFPDNGVWTVSFPGGNYVRTFAGKVKTFIGEKTAARAAIKQFNSATV